MSLTTIRSFKRGQVRYRHGMCFDTDMVFLQRYQDNEEATCDDDLWVTLLKYDSGCNVTTPDGNAYGRISLVRGDTWAFKPADGDDAGEIEYTSRHAEVILDLEVLVSQRFVEEQQVAQAIAGFEVNLAVVNTLQVQIEQLMAQQDELLKPHAMLVTGLIAECESLEDMGRIGAHLDTWPRGFYRSEVRTVWNQRAQQSQVWAGKGPVASSSKALPANTSEDGHQ